MAVHINIKEILITEGMFLDYSLFKEATTDFKEISQKII